MKSCHVLRHLLLVLALVLNGTMPAGAAVRQTQLSPPLMHCHHAAHGGEVRGVPAHHSAGCCRGGSSCHCPAAVALPAAPATPAVSAVAVQRALAPLLRYTSLDPSVIFRPPIA